MKKPGIMLIPLLVLALGVSVIACDDTSTPPLNGMGYTGGEETFKVNHTSRPSSVINRMWEYVDERLQHYTDGQVKLEIFPMGILYESSDEFIACSIGAVDMVSMGASSLVDAGLPDFMISSLPFFFGETAADVFDHDRRFIEHPDGGGKLLSQLESKGIKGLAIVQGSGALLIVGKEEVTSLFDMADSKARSVGGVGSLLFKFVGIDEVSVSAGEMGIAFQTGMIDFGTIGPDQAYASKYWEIADHGFYYVPVTSHRIISMNLELWESLSSELQDIIMNRVIPEANDWHRINSGERAEWYLQEIIKEGMIVHQQTDEERVALRDGILAMPEARPYVNQIDPDMIQLVNSLR